MKRELIDKLEILLENSGIQEDVYFVYEDGTKTKRKVFLDLYGKRPCVKKINSKKYGHILNVGYEKVIDVIPVLHKKIDKAEQWHIGWEKVRDRLERSKLWPDMLANIKTALEIGYVRLQKVSEILDSKQSEDYHDNQRLIVQAVKDYEPRLVKRAKEEKLKDGTVIPEHDYYSTAILWYMTTPPKVKKMRFAEKNWNDEKLAEIKKAYDKNEKITVSGRTNYDVSFDGNFPEKRAWYSEEYKGCGNGHYYLALDCTHALFYEDD